MWHGPADTYRQGDLHSYRGICSHVGVSALLALMETRGSYRTPYSTSLEPCHKLWKSTQRHSGTPHVQSSRFRRATQARPGCKLELPCCAYDTLSQFQLCSEQRLNARVCVCAPARGEKAAQCFRCRGTLALHRRYLACSTCDLDTVTHTSPARTSKLTPHEYLKQCMGRVTGMCHPKRHYLVGQSLIPRLCVCDGSRACLCLDACLCGDARDFPLTLRALLLTGVYARLRLRGA